MRRATQAVRHSDECAQRDGQTAPALSLMHICFETYSTQKLSLNLVGKCAEARLQMTRRKTQTTNLHELGFSDGRVASADAAASSSSSLSDGRQVTDTRSNKHIQSSGATQWPPAATTTMTRRGLPSTKSTIMSTIKWGGRARG